MTGLLMKDLLRFRWSILGMLGVMATCGVVFSMRGDGSVSLFCGMSIVLVLIITDSSFLDDALARWDRYALCLPVRRRDLVASKYLFVITLAVIGAALAFVMCTVIGFLCQELLLEELVSSIAAAIGEGLLIMSIQLPLIFKFGIKKFRFIILGAMLISLVMISLLPLLNLSILMTQAWLAPLAGLLFLGLSYFISVAIFQRKEL